MAKTGIYEIVNLANGKRYVGSAVKFSQRWHKHRSMLRRGVHGNYLLQAAWDKHGEDGFAFRIIEVCEKPQLLVREQIHIDHGCDYNLAPVAGSPLGVKHTDATRQKFSEARKGKPKPEEWRKAAARGVAQSWQDPEVRARRSEAIRRNWQERKAQGYRHPALTEDQAKRRSELAHTPELVAARKARMTGTALSETHRSAISAGNKGRQVSPETRAKISRSLRDRAKV